METKTMILIIYMIIGAIILLFNKFLGDLLYKLGFYFADKFSLKQVAVSKVDHDHRDPMVTLSRIFTLAFGLGIIFACLHFLY